MPPKSKNPLSTKGTDKRKLAKDPKLFVPTHTQMKAWAATLIAGAGSINTQIGHHVHWPAHMTRSIVPADVDEKIKMFQMSLSEHWKVKSILDNYKEILMEENSNASKTF